MPALVSRQYTDYRAVYASYIGTYIDRDVKEISGIIDSLKFMDFIIYSLFVGADQPRMNDGDYRRSPIVSLPIRNGRTKMAAPTS